jgi:transposase
MENEILREAVKIAIRTNLSRNTVRKWLKVKESAMIEPQYPERQVKSVVDHYIDQLRDWLQNSIDC